MSTKFPYTFFRAKLHPEIRAALDDRRRASSSELGHTIVAADPDYNLGMSWNFLSRSTSGLLDWADRLGHDVNTGQAHAWPISGPAGCCRRTRCARPAPAKPNAQRRIGWIFNLVDVVLAPTTAQPPPDGAPTSTTAAACPPTAR